MSRYVIISDDERQALIQILHDRIPSLLNRLVYEWDDTPGDEWYRAQAAEEPSDAELEFDDECLVSRGDDDGAYVMAWVWVDGTPPEENDDETEG